MDCYGCYKLKFRDKCTNDSDEQIVIHQCREHERKSPRSTIASSKEDINAAKIFTLNRN